MTVTLYHNPRCSKSRAALKLLNERGVSVNVIDYQKKPPSPMQLKNIAARLGVSPRALLRTNEAAYRANQLGDLQLGDDEIIDAIVAHPILLQRPIATAGHKAVIGRPPENILDVL